MKLAATYATVFAIVADMKSWRHLIPVGDTFDCRVICQVLHDLGVPYLRRPGAYHFRASKLDFLSAHLLQVLATRHLTTVKLCVRERSNFLKDQAANDRGVCLAEIN